MSFRTKVQLSNGYGRLVIKVSNLIFLLAFLFSFCTLSTVAEDTRPYASIISAGNWFNIEPITISDSDAADQTCARFSVGSIVSPPPELKSHNGTLEVTMRFLMAVDSQGLTRYCYVTDTGLESPTLRVNPGDKLTIHFENDLPANLASSSDVPPMKTGNPAVGSALNSGCSGDMSPFATNMHFHGMNVAPTCGQDEIVRTLIQPGQAFDYELQIPLNEPPGLYWYHPHPHGLGNTQVLGGATGVLIVEGLQAIDTALASLPERTFVIRDQNVRPPKAVVIPMLQVGTYRSIMFQ